jgi:hypothetical protein
MNVNQQIQIYPVFAALTPGNTTVALKVNNILAPPTEDPNNSVAITTSMQNGSVVDTAVCAVVGVLAEDITLTANNTFVVGK